MGALTEETIHTSSKCDIPKANSIAKLVPVMTSVAGILQNLPVYTNFAYEGYKPPKTKSLSKVSFIFGQSLNTPPPQTALHREKREVRIESC